MTTLQEIYQAWQHDLQFREAFQENPIQALKKAGFTVSPADLTKIESLLKLKKMQSKDEALNKRENK